MEAFSDGIFAIASTLLVLDLAVPAASLPDVGQRLLDQWPIYLGYLVSFATIGAGLARPFGHHGVPRPGGLHPAAPQPRAAVLRVGAAVSHPHARGVLFQRYAERIAVTVYGLNLLAINGFISVLWHYAVAEHLVRRDNSEADVRTLTSKLDPSLVSYAVVIGIGLVQPKVAVALYLAITLFVIIPFRAVIRLIRRAVAARRQKGQKDGLT